MSLLCTLMLVIGLAVLVPGASTAGAATTDDEIRRLEAAVARYPNEPDLLWALARAFERSGRSSEAIAELSHLTRRWPNWRASAYFELGKLLHYTDRNEEALSALEQGLLRDPVNPSARMQRGLVLRALGRHTEAERELEIAGHFEPRLQTETHFLRAISQLERGERAQAQALLQEVIELEPTGEMARRAQLILNPPETKRPSKKSRVRFTALSGIERDSNVTLEGTNSSTSTDEEDTRLLWGAGVSFRAFETEQTKLSIGYSYSQNSHHDLETYDMLNHVVYSSLSFQPRRRVRMRLDAMATDSHLDTDRYLRSWRVRPNLFYSIGRRAGMTRVYFDVERANYHRNPIFTSLEQGGSTYGLGLEHYVSIPGWKRAWASIGSKASRTNTKASRDILGYSGAFDRVRMQSSVRAHLPLVWNLVSDVSLSFSWNRYKHKNLFDFLGGASNPSRRQDRIVRPSISLTRPLNEHLKLELRWTGHFQYSNIGTYKYDRSIFGVYFRAETS